jgi:hypothetical protein
MNHRVGVAFTAFLITLGGCALLSAPVLNPGETEADVIAKLGRPTHRFQDGSEHLLEYMHGPAGQETFIARFGANDRLISFQQVLTTVQFATLKVGSATKSDVLHAIGTPSETSYLARVDARSFRPGRHRAQDAKRPGPAPRSGLALAILALKTGFPAAQENHNCGFSFSDFECSLFNADKYALAEATTISRSAPTPLTIRPARDKRIVTSPCD